MQPDQEQAIAPAEILLPRSLKGECATLALDPSVSTAHQGVRALWHCAGMAHCRGQCYRLRKRALHPQSLGNIRWKTRPPAAPASCRAVWHRPSGQGRSPRRWRPAMWSPCAPWLPGCRRPTWPTCWSFYNPISASSWCRRWGRPSIRRCCPSSTRRCATSSRRRCPTTCWHAPSRGWRPTMRPTSSRASRRRTSRRSWRRSRPATAPRSSATWNIRKRPPAVSCRRTSWRCRRSGRSVG